MKIIIEAKEEVKIGIEVEEGKTPSYSDVVAYLELAKQMVLQDWKAVLDSKRIATEDVNASN